VLYITPINRKQQKHKPRGHHWYTGIKCGNNTNGLLTNTEGSILKS